MSTKPTYFYGPSSSNKLHIPSHFAALKSHCGLELTYAYFGIDKDPPEYLVCQECKRIAKEAKG